VSAGISVVIPAYNEAAALKRVVQDIETVLRDVAGPSEIVIVDDGSTDGTGEIARELGARVISHPTNMGYGASLKTGIRHASHDRIVITDADGTYDISAIPALARDLEAFHMVVGARRGVVYRGSWAKFLARHVFRFLSEFTTGRRIPDINSGLRAFRKETAVRFFDITSDRFSFTTTMTLAMMLNGYFVKYVPVEYFPRLGQSKVDHYRDTLRAAQSIVQCILYYNPLKLFLLPAGFLGAVAAILAIGAAVSRDSVVLLGAVTALAGAILMAGLGLLADVLRRGALPR
jgi:glycosyltransferase involved in cell wall biosynthesis